MRKGETKKILVQFAEDTSLLTTWIMWSAKVRSSGLFSHNVMKCWFPWNRGFWGGYVKEYIEATEPVFSIGEYWDSLAYEGGQVCYNQGSTSRFLSVATLFGRWSMKKFFFGCLFGALCEGRNSALFTLILNSSSSDTRKWLPCNRCPSAADNQLDKCHWRHIIRLWCHHEGQENTFWGQSTCHGRCFVISENFKKEDLASRKGVSSNIFRHYCQFYAVHIYSCECFYFFKNY